MEAETHACDVLVIGSGAAGLRAGIAAQEADRDVLVVGRRPLRDAHTVLAAGGINAALGTRDSEDCWEQHFADTLAEAYFLAHPRTVELLAREAPAAVHELAAWGAEFTRTDDGEIDQRYFGAHTHRRTCYAGDFTGRAVLTAVADRAEALGVPVREGLVVTRLLVTDGTCVGAYAVDLATGDPLILAAQAIVLAAGGHTRLWRRTTSRARENTGDGIALGLHAGCRIADAGLVQFHPTGMVAPAEYEGTLVTEAVRGEGGQLRNADGERFMERYDPDRLELSTRDVVARAIFTEIADGRGTDHDAVWLDVSHLGTATIEEKLPRMREQLRAALEVDIAEEPIEVSPTAHYSMGGVVVEPDTHATDLDGLFAAGECTAGLHGANRLGGNSLAETIVFGRRAGEAAARHARGGTAPRPAPAAEEAAEELAAAVGDADATSDEVLERLRTLMWQRCGVVRDADGLRAGLDELAGLRGDAAGLRADPGEHGWEAVAGVLDVRNALLAAEVTLRSALERRESRGAHHRRDFPEPDDAFVVNLVARLAGDAIELDREPVPPIPDELRPWVEAVGELEMAGRLLE